MPSHDAAEPAAAGPPGPADRQRATRSDVVDIVGYFRELRRFAAPALLVAVLVFVGAFMLAGRGTDARSTLVDARVAVLPASADASATRLTDLRVLTGSYAATVSSPQVLPKVSSEPGRGWTAAGVKAAVTTVTPPDSLLLDLRVQGSSVEDGIALANSVIAALQDEGPRQLPVTIGGATPILKVVSPPAASLTASTSTRSSLQSLILAGLGALVAGFLVGAGLLARADRARRRSGS